MKPLTFDQWKSAGYHVRKGQRSHTTNRGGEPTFTRDQVDETRSFDLRQWKVGEDRDFTDAADSMQ